MVIYFILPFFAFGQIDCDDLKIDDSRAYIENNLYTGVCKLFYDNQMIKSNRNYKNGYLSGDSAIINYYPNGLIKSIVSFQDGERKDYKEFKLNSKTFYFKYFEETF